MRASLLIWSPRHSPWDPPERINTKSRLGLGTLRCSTHWMIQSNREEHFKIINYKESLQIDKKTLSH